MKIYLPHIHYTVHVKPFKKRVGVPEIALDYTERHDNNSCTVFLGKRNMPGDIAHELVHVLQFICIARNMDFCTETEHMGYIMHFLMGKIMGHSYK